MCLQADLSCPPSTRDNADSARARGQQSAEALAMLKFGDYQALHLAEAVVRDASDVGATGDTARALLLAAQVHHNLRDYPAALAYAARAAGAADTACGLGRRDRARLCLSLGTGRPRADLRSQDPRESIGRREDGWPVDIVAILTDVPIDLRPLTSERPRRIDPGRWLVDGGTPRGTPGQAQWRRRARFAIVHRRIRVQG